MTVAFLPATALAARRLLHHVTSAQSSPLSRVQPRTPRPGRYARQYPRASSSGARPQPPPPPKPPGPTMVRARHILVDSEDMVDALRKQLDAGDATFAELATMVSTCPSKDKGGDLGWFRRHTMVREFEDAAFGHAPGSLVKVKSDFGWHLISVEDHGVEADTISVTELSRRFVGPAADALPAKAVQLVDVRERHEVDIASLPGFLVLPMSEYERWADDFESGALGLDKNVETVVMCHHGIRSANFCSFLRQSGFTVVRNLTGGIDAYSKEVDPSIPRY